MFSHRRCLHVKRLFYFRIHVMSDILVPTSVSLWRRLGMFAILFDLTFALPNIETNMENKCVPVFVS